MCVFHCTQEVAHLQVCLAYKDEVLEHERKEHLAQVKAAMEQLGQKNLLIENLQVTFSPGSSSYQSSGTAQPLQHSTG